MPRPTTDTPAPATLRSRKRRERARAGIEVEAFPVTVPKEDRKAVETFIEKLWRIAMRHAPKP